MKNKDKDYKAADEDNKDNKAAAKFKRMFPHERVQDPPTAEEDKYMTHLLSHLAMILKNETVPVI